ncbi:MAG: DUF4890 domain-containing protein [Spirosomaceae bacterium]|nr:DUF4890 domain-containing protein [Spirosomataceae bacterium]
MKNSIALIAVALSFATLSCVTSPPQQGSTATTNPNARTISVEAEARQKTDSMAKLLSLTATQKDDVMLANTVYFKVLKNLRDNNETSKMGSATESYMSKLKTILSSEQYSKFESEMGG